MNVQKALEIKKALITLSDYLEIDPQLLTNSICFLLEKEKFTKFKIASDLWNEFDDADIVRRAELLGIKMTLNKK